MKGEGINRRGGDTERWSQREGVTGEGVAERGVKGEGVTRRGGVRKMECQ